MIVASWGSSTSRMSDALAAARRESGTAGATHRDNAAGPDVAVAVAVDSINALSVGVAVGAAGVVPEHAPNKDAITIK